MLSTFRAHLMSLTWPLDAAKPIGRCIRHWLFSNIHKSICDLSMDELVDVILTGIPHLRIDSQIEPCPNIPPHPSVYTHVDLYVGLLMASETREIEHTIQRNTIEDIRLEAHRYYTDIFRRSVIAARDTPYIREVYKLRQTNKPNLEEICQRIVTRAWAGRQTQCHHYAMQPMQPADIAMITRHYHRGYNCCRYSIPGIQECNDAMRIMHIANVIRDLQYELASAVKKKFAYEFVSIDNSGDVFNEICAMTSGEYQHILDRIYSITTRLRIENCHLDILMSKFTPE